MECFPKELPSKPSLHGKREQSQEGEERKAITENNIQKRSHEEKVGRFLCCTWFSVAEDQSAMCVCVCVRTHTLIHVYACIA